MQLDKTHRLEIKVAGRDDEGDFVPPLYDTVDAFLQADPHGTADFVFRVVDTGTGKEPEDMAEAYQNVNDAYSAFVRHKQAEKARQDAINALADGIRKKGVSLSYYTRCGEWYVNAWYSRNGIPKTLHDNGKDLKDLLERVMGRIEGNEGD